LPFPIFFTPFSQGGVIPPASELVAIALILRGYELKFQNSNFAKVIIPFGLSPPKPCATSSVGNGQKARPTLCENG